MSKCPNCAAPISEALSKEGGTCPRCAHYILPTGNDFELEPSDTQERLTESVSSFEATQLDMITFEDTDEMEATELIGRIPKMSKGSLGDDSIQEDFPDEDFLDEEDYIVVDEKKEAPKNSSVGLILILLCITGILSGYLYTLNQPPELPSGGVERLSVDYNSDVDQFVDPVELAKKKKKEEEARKKEEEKLREQEKKRKASVRRDTEQVVELDEKVEKLLDLFLGTFEECVDRETIKNPDFETTISYRITINKDGAVINPSISASGNTSEKFTGCLNRAVKNWQFPKREKEITFRRTY